MTHCAPPVTSGFGICGFNFFSFNLARSSKLHVFVVLKWGPLVPTLFIILLHVYQLRCLSQSFDLSYSLCIISNIHIKSKFNHLR